MTCLPYKYPPEPPHPPPRPHVVPDRSTLTLLPGISLGWRRERVTSAGAETLKHTNLFELLLKL